MGLFGVSVSLATKQERGKEVSLFPHLGKLRQREGVNERVSVYMSHPMTTGNQAIIFEVTGDPKPNHRIFLLFSKS